MDASRAERIMDGYVSWWRSQISICQEDGCVRILCPMLDRHNDFMSIYMIDDQGDNGGVIITDLGETIGDLASSGCDVMSESRRPKLERTIAGYGTSLKDGELFIRTSESALFESINMLMQTMASVDDLYYTVRDTSRHYIIDEIASWLDELDIRYTQDIKITGRSGFETKFDFLISGSRVREIPERYIKAINSPTQSGVSNALFGWEDISRSRSNSQSFLFMNSSGSSDGRIDASLVEACENYGVVPVAWNKGADDRIREQLAA